MAWEKGRFQRKERPCLSFLFTYGMLYMVYVSMGQGSSSLEGVVNADS